VFVAAARVEIHIPESSSLKDKRRVIQSVSKRLRNEFPVSVAEIEAQEQWGLAVLGLAVVSGSASHAREVLDAALRHAERARLDAEIGAVDIDVIQVL
jgi:uncharacterized protein YlxP (DUF503 family)